MNLQKALLASATILLMIQQLSAQNVTLDSLNNLAKSLACRDIAQSDSISNHVLARAEDPSTVKGYAYKNLALNQYCQGGFDEVIRLSALSIDQFDQVGDLKGASGPISYLIAIYLRTNEYDSVRKYNRRLLNIGQQLHDTLILITAYTNIGGRFTRLSENDSVIHYMVKALKMAGTGEYEKQRADLLTGIGNAYYQNEDFSLALDYFQQAETVYLKINDQTNQQMIDINMGTCLMELNQLDSAKIRLNRVIENSIAQKNDYYLAFGHSGMSAVLLKEARYKEAIFHTIKGIELSKKFGDRRNTAVGLTNLVRCYTKTGQLSKAVEIGKEAIKVAEESNDIDRQANANFLLSDALEKAGRFEEALTAYKSFYMLDSTMLNKSKSQAIYEIETKYETEKKELQIEKLSQQATIQSLQISRQNYITLGLISLLIIVVGGSTLVYRQRKLKQDRELANLELAEAKKRLEVEKQYREAELKALRSQMNPHFIFNALNSIQEYIVTNEKKLAGKYLGKFADLMRMYLKHSQSQTISAREEIDALDIYLELEKVRFNDELDYSIKTDKLMSADLLSIPPLLIQPFVENSLKHGLLHKKEDRRLYVEFSNEDENVLVCAIEDNGIGREKSAEINKMRRPDHQSFATSAIQTRLELLNENLEQPISVEIQDLKNGDEALGTKVLIRIPLMEE